MGNRLTKNDKAIVLANPIQNLIFSVRGVQVMLDSDLAKIYGVETKVFNRAVKRNIERFPDSFRFQLTKEEYENLRCQFGTSSQVSQNVIPGVSSSLRSQFATSSGHGGRRYLPYVFTEQGVAMLSAVLRSETAVKVSIKIMEAFVEMRRFLQNNADVFARMESVERHQLSFEITTEENFEKVFSALQSAEPPTQGIFFKGQIFDAYSFVSKLVRKAKVSIRLIDNYVDDTVLTLLVKRRKGVGVTIYTGSISKQLRLDLQKHNAQYPGVIVKTLTQAHDRFLILDDIQLYHFGASLKDLGKKWFAFSKVN